MAQARLHYETAALAADSLLGSSGRACRTRWDPAPGDIAPLTRVDKAMTKSDAVNTA